MEGKKYNTIFAAVLIVTNPSDGGRVTQKIKIMNKIKNHATNLRASRVVPSQMKGEDVVNNPSEERNNTDIDVFNSVWGAEKAYFFLYFLKRVVDLFNEGKLEDPNIKKPIPHFKTVYSFFVWVQETNPKTVKWFIREVALYISRCEEWVWHPDNPQYDDGISDFYRDFARYIKNNVEIDNDKE